MQHDNEGDLVIVGGCQSCCRVIVAPSDGAVARIVGLDADLQVVELDVAVSDVRRLPLQLSGHSDLFQEREHRRGFSDPLFPHRRNKTGGLHLEQVRPIHHFKTSPIVDAGNRVVSVSLVASPVGKHKIKSGDNVGSSFILAKACHHLPLTLSIQYGIGLPD